MPDAQTTTWQQLAALRLRRQHLERRASRRHMLDVVRDHVAVQAQVMGSAELAVHARVDGLKRDDIRHALWRDRTLVKTWAMRGTLHLVAADELPELVAGLGTRIAWTRALWLRYFEVTLDEMLALQDGIGDVLSDRPMTRAALGAALARKLGNEAFADRVTSSWGTFLKPAASRGYLCFGPDDGRNVTFVDPRDWLGREMPEPTPDALAPIIERQLHAFPGSSKGELARWWGVQGGATLRKPIASLGDRLTELRADGTKVLVLTEDLETLARIEPSRTIRLLPGFDPYTLGLQKEADPLLPIKRRPLVSRTAGWISQVLLVGGAVQGTWTHEVKKDRLLVDLVPWRRLTKPERTAVDDEAARIAAFLGASPEVTVEAPA
jgi:winged helix DNA-binding protein